MYTSDKNSQFFMEWKVHVEIYLLYFLKKKNKTQFTPLNS